MNDEHERILILGKATSHITDKIIKDFTCENRDISFIPGGLIKFFQPLDVVKNKHFKSSMKEKIYCFLYR